MCLILFSINKHPKYRIIVAANRDEFYERPTAQADFWQDHPHVLAGRDLSAGGTWMGINTAGQIAMLTNYRDMSGIKDNAKSRGALVADFLIDAEIDNMGYLEKIRNEDDEYNGYNLLFGSAKGLAYYSNISRKEEFLTEGVFGLSNHLLDTPWPKVKRGREELETIIKQQDIKEEDIFATLYDDIKAPDHQLPDTGIGLEKERMLSSMFIKSADYGSRCSTIVMADYFGNWHFHERTYNIRNFSYSTRTFQLQEEK